jgi:hypothetical protein
MWIPFRPQLPSRHVVEELLDFAKRLSTPPSAAEVELNTFIELARKRAIRRVGEKAPRARQPAYVAIHLLADLAKQQWKIRVSKGEVQVQRPQTEAEVGEATRRLTRLQLHAERDAQLREPSVQTFIRSMESKQLFHDKFVSVFSLMRDGQDLADRLRNAAKQQSLKEVIRPYLQFVKGEETCTHTGYRLSDIWRYFRHTWANPYKSIPGRSMMVLVRDAAAPFHPIIGIAAVKGNQILFWEENNWQPMCKPCHDEKTFKGG